MAVNSTSPTEEAQNVHQSESEAAANLNPIMVEAVRKGIEARLDEQQEFQEVIRLQSSASSDSADEFRQALVVFIRNHLENTEASLPEAAVAILEELGRIESKMRQASEKLAEEKAARERGQTESDTASPDQGVDLQDPGFQ